MSFIFVAIFGCSGGADDVSVDVQTFDCEQRCWGDDMLTVPARYWDGWTDGSACGDAGLYLTYGEVCVATNRVCESDWADDPAVGDASACCANGVSAEELQTAPLCAR